MWHWGVQQGSNMNTTMAPVRIGSMCDAPSSYVVRTLEKEGLHEMPWYMAPNSQETLMSVYHRKDAK